jgi:hypothetical protein
MTQIAKNSEVYYIDETGEIDSSTLVDIVKGRDLYTLENGISTGTVYETQEAAEQARKDMLDETDNNA